MTLRMLVTARDTLAAIGVSLIGGMTLGSLAGGFAGLAVSREQSAAVGFVIGLLAGQEMWRRLLPVISEAEGVAS